MKKYFSMLVSMALILSVLVSPVWAAGGKVRSDKAEGPAGTEGGGKVQTSRGTAAGNNSLSLDTLTPFEINRITYMREEEKLARDVYLTLYGEYKAPIFGNISESEQRHMDALKRLIDKHELEEGKRKTYYSGFLLALAVMRDRMLPICKRFHFG